MRRRWTGLPWWARAVIVAVVIRIALLPPLLLAWHEQGPNRTSYPQGSPTFGRFLGESWDGYWYRRIAGSGYPPTLPVGPDGTVQQNAWAFYPVFPFLCRAVMTVTALPWDVAGPLVATLCGLGAAVVVARVVQVAAPAAVHARPALPELAAAAVTAFPSAGVLTIAYSEATALLLIAVSLLLLHRRRYGWAALAIVVLGFTRAAALPMVVVVLWHGIARWRSRGWEDFAPRDRVVVLLLAAVGGVSGLIWPWLTAAVTGVPDAYFRTQSAWRAGAAADVPFRGVADKLAEWVGSFALPLVLVGAVVVIVLSFTPPARRLGPELQAWGGSYLVYLLAVGTLSSSLLRFALLSITLPLALVAWPRRRWMQAVLVVALVALQAVWLLRILVYDGPGDAFAP
ncbi:hypothetical protein V6N00_14940 [Tersicoccus sp. MR15.9]|uniref:hypothetical protein n=1 Tax=Tersicoccus mangrovi TaxID=3121635 RepID=UPI002FE661FB